MQSAEATEQFYSRLADDPDLADQVELFVDTLPRLIATLREYADQHDWQAVELVAHQLKGSSGCYGFDEVSSRAALLEETCRQGEGEIIAALADLQRLCGCVRSKQRPK